MRDKLGLFGVDDKDKFLILDLLTWMHEKKADYTNTFCYLMDMPIKDEIYNDKRFIEWVQAWNNRSNLNNLNKEDQFQLMKKVNPVIIPRNHKVEEALEAAEQNDLKPFNKILEILEKPYDEQEVSGGYQSPSMSDKEYKTFCGT